MNLVSEIMNANPICCTALTRIDEIERIMKEQNITEIPIVDSLYEKNFIGVITEDEIIKKATEEAVNHSDLNAEKCLVTNPVAIHPDSSVDECYHLMDLNHLNRIPVIDGSGHFCGVVDKKDSRYKESADLMTEDEKVDQASEDSFPASDPPGYR